jgi:hypothetical protein
MAFEIDKLAAFAVDEITKFTLKNQEETYYAFTIDACYLRINSIEEYERTLQKLIAKYPEHYTTEDEKLAVKDSVGDWTIIADFGLLNNDSETGPYDYDLYDEHYDMSDEEQSSSDYALAMNKILGILIAKDVFSNLKRTADFIIRRSEHDY